MKLGIRALPLKGMDDKAPGTSSLPICDQTYMSNTHHGVNNIENIGHKSIAETSLWYYELMSILTKMHTSFTVLVILQNVFHWMMFPNAYIYFWPT